MNYVLTNAHLSSVILGVHCWMEETNELESVKLVIPLFLYFELGHGLTQVITFLDE